MTCVLKCVYLIVFINKTREKIHWHFMKKTLSRQKGNSDIF